MTKYEELCRLAAANEPNWPELDEAGYMALPEDPPPESGFFRRRNEDGVLMLCWWHRGAVDMMHAKVWGTAPERRN